MKEGAHVTLNEDGTRAEAAELIRSLIDRIGLTPVEGCRYRKLHPIRVDLRSAESCHHPAACWRWSNGYWIGWRRW